MIIAIDIDDTLTLHPQKFQSLIEMHKSNGDDVYLLTDLIQPDCWEKLPDNKRIELMSGRKRQVERYLPTHVMDMLTDIIIACGNSLNFIANAKARFCRDSNVSIVYDDNPIYCNVIKRNCPQCMVCQIRK